MLHSGSFRPCPETLSEHKMRGNELICFVGEVSGQLFSICAMVPAHCCQSDPQWENRKTWEMCDWVSVQRKQI